VKAAARDMDRPSASNRPTKTFEPRVDQLFTTQRNPKHMTMSQKRKYGEQSGEASSAPKPFKKHRSFQPGQSNERPKHNRRPNLSHDDDNGRSTNALKSRIRDLKRFLTHMDSVPKHKMSAGARQERERELEACEHELAEKVNASREAEYRKKMIGKYHQVRFFGMC
jgi:hypothetical protein